MKQHRSCRSDLLRKKAFSVYESIVTMTTRMAVDHTPSDGQLKAKAKLGVHSASTRADGRGKEKDRKLINQISMKSEADLDLPSLITVSCLCKRINAVALAQFVPPHTDPVAAEAESPILSFLKYHPLLTFMHLFLPAADFNGQQLRKTSQECQSNKEKKTEKAVLQEGDESEQREGKLNILAKRPMLAWGQIGDFFGIRSTAPSLRFGGSSRLPFNSMAALRLSFSMKCPIGFLSFQFSSGDYVKEMEQINNAPEVEYPEGAKFDGPIVNRFKDLTLSRANFMFSDFFRD
ncbi:hypothetical protein F5146DRAFT_1162125 [Armillaria mellea]|nr:hypothetical protein F5146DRAFT_1162125 [Armillaria mellea]